LQLRYEEIDLEYVEDWVKKLGLDEAWQQVRSFAGIE
jgi:hypothetical protein